MLQERSLRESKRRDQIAERNNNNKKKKNRRKIFKVGAEYLKIFWNRQQLNNNTIKCGVTKTYRARDNVMQ